MHNDNIVLMKNIHNKYTNVYSVTIQLILYFVNIIFLGASINLLSKQINSNKIYPIIFFVILATIFIYYSLLLVFKWLFIFSFKENQIQVYKSKKFLLIALFLSFKFKLFKQVKLQKHNKNQFKTAKKINKDNKDIVFTGSFALFLLFSNQRKINDLDICSKTSDITKLKIDNESFYKNSDSFVDKYLVQTEVNSVKIDASLFKFIPKKHIIKVKNFNIPDEYFQFASKLHQFLKVFLLQNNDFKTNKLNDIIKDLKIISDLENFWNYELLKEAYINVLLCTSMFALVSKQESLQQHNINLKQILDKQKMSFGFYIYTEKLNHFEIIDKLESDKDIRALKESFNNDFENVIKNEIVILKSYDWYKPIVSFQTEEQKIEFLNKHQLNLNYENKIWKDFEFSYQYNTQIDIREIFFRFIEREYYKK
ncbi:MAG4530 family protein [Mycoplasma leonicaptivi]|uniref:MAG4530 family protein n=1 Tax=Mycoplasma leonicaptivi TaxID=36742 RepID=UPI000488D544|nr:hypothetical protein [Mycoplasma leonicaptivi]